MIQCQVERIDERGVTFHSPRFDATFVPNDKIKAVELENRSRATKIDITKRDRLLTLPRLQKEDPPTHLIRSIDGDYLRGRLVELDNKTLTIEVRQDTRHVGRDQIASVIWLDKPEPKDKPDKKDKADQPKKPAGGTTATADNRVQSLRRDGVRMTFRPEKVAGTVLQGTSEVLGACRVELGEVDQLVIGRAIEQFAKSLPYQRWSLLPAVEPKFAQAGQGGGAGTESELVGKPAPDFELDTLDGRRFRLSDQRKKIVVVDFWATWCGPCRQTLPELVRTVDKFHDKNVVLLTVNLQESPEAIKTMLEHMELKMPVGLDSTGSVAEKYAAVAIPQTVIIDGNGNVARLFVGGGPQYSDQLTEALQTLVNPAADKSKPE
jgi:peroxiredoxin